MKKTYIVEWTTPLHRHVRDEINNYTCDEEIDAYCDGLFIGGGYNITYREKTDEKSRKTK